MTVRINDILDEVSAYIPDADTKIIEKAYVFSARIHQGQTRLSGEPYLNHPLEVAWIITQMRLDAASIAAGLLHDTIEDSLTSVDDIKEEFGDEVASLVDGLTKISKISFRSKEKRQAENFRKMILAMNEDLRVLLIKVADRLHNMETLEYHDPASQHRIARETLDIYAPLANRLGIYWIKTRLEGLSLKYLDPEGYVTLKANLDAKAKEKGKYLEDIMNQVRSELEKVGIKGKVAGRIKKIYSVYQKLKSQNIPFENVYDILGIRIILNTVEECYKALGIIHSMWKPIQFRFKDFIAMPKQNMYQSLHTTILAPLGERIEIQIRTYEMDRIANEGIAAHWCYKEGIEVSEHDGKKFAWLRQLLEWQSELKDPKEFLQSVKVDLYPEEVYVFTPKGDVLRFPAGATPLDFAYSVHTQLGHQCIGARVNDQIVPLRYKLRSGDVVEILRSARQHPSKDWLRIVKTSRARTKIRVWIHTQEREQSISLGKEIIEKSLKSHNISLSKIIKDGSVDKIATGFSLKSTEDLFAAVGFGRISANQVVHKVVPETAKTERKTRPSDKKQDIGGVTVKGVENLLVRFAKCCRPLPGDEVVGFITKGRGITVHRSSCPYVSDIDQQRLVPVEWDNSITEMHEVEFSVICHDKPGMLGSISATIGAQGINITKARIQSFADGTSTCLFRVLIKDIYELKSLFKKIQGLKGIEKLERQQSF
ncbi:MAG: bifunctional (p)ppGpp synthetase/guanosine-3',5'-bis(diphosphate) 3'-pyrophosphohydrolase [Deltaproteobacteria bacterium]|nr:bifunctional (p)ppGpp synthetase/guanosine-3',5'-bis(diphosphate) 3'-pyrophosphohydrolase [Deltaproteobacteria bacterium]